MKIRILAIFFIIAANIFAQNHFNSVEPTGNPYHIVLQKILIDGNTLKPGDEIGIFDGELCVGSYKIISSNQENIDVVTWKGDTNYGLDGFVSGNKIIVKLWVDFYGSYKEVDVNPIFVQGDGTFGSNNFSIVNINDVFNYYPQIFIENNSINFGEVEMGSSINGFITLRNIGNQRLTITNVSINNNQFSLLSNSYFIISPGDSQQVILRFNPNSTSPTNSFITIYSNDPNQPITKIDLYGQGIPQKGSRIFISSDIFEFGNIAIGLTGKKTVELSNVGTERLDIYSINSSNTRFSVNNSNFSLSPGDSKIIEIVFVPSFENSVSGTISINSNSINNPQINLQVSGRGFISHFSPVQPTGLPYNIIINNVDIDSHNLSIGDEIAIFCDSICVGSNIYTGNYPISIITWKENSELGLDGYKSNDSIKIIVYGTTFGGQYELMPEKKWINDNGLFDLGSFSSVSLKIISNLEPKIALDKKKIEFDNVEVGNQKTLPINIYNNGETNLEISSIYSTSNCFYASANNLTLKAKSSKQINITFQPDSIQYYSGEIIFNSNDPVNRVISLSISGVGLPSLKPLIRTDITKVNFNPVSSSDTSYYQLTIYNDGSGTLNLQSIYTSSVEFKTLNKTMTIQPNGIGAIDLFFNSTTEGIFDALLSIKNNSDNEPILDLPLKGISYEKFFNTIKPSGIPYNIIFNEINFPESIIPNFGDQIGIFDSATCVGIFPIINPDSINNNSHNAIAWQESNDNEGFVIGHDIQIRYFNKSDKKVYSFKENLLKGDGAFGYAPYTILDGNVELTEIKPNLLNQIPQIVIKQDSLYNNLEFGFENYFSHPFVDLKFSAEALNNNELSVKVINNTGLFIQPTDDWYGLSNVVISAFDDYFYVKDTVSILVKPVIPESVNLIQPIDNSIGNIQPISFNWSSSNRSEEFRIQIGEDSSFSEILIDSSSLGDTTIIFDKLANLTSYNWRVLTYNLAGESAWSEVWRFKTLGEPTIVELLQPADNAVNQGIDQVFKWSMAADQTVSKKKKVGEEVQLVGNYWFELSTDTTKISNVIDSTLTDTTKTVSGLSYSTEYWWRVKSRNEVGWSEFSEWSKFTTIIEKPEIVNLITPNNNELGLLIPISLKWRTAARTSSYSLQVSKDNSFTTTIIDTSSLIDTTMILNDLEDLTSYYWRVKGVNVGGESDWSEVWSFRTLGEPTIVELLQPADNAVNQGIDQVFKWSKAEDQTVSKKKKVGEEVQIVGNYWFELSTDTTKISNVIDSTLTDTTKSINGLEYLTSYWWRVKSRNEVGWSGFTKWSKFTTIIEKPEVVELGSPTNNTVGLSIPVELKWESSERASTYQLQVSENNNFSSSIIDTTITDTSFTLSKLSDLNNYYWQVKGVNIGGESAWSEAWSFKTLGEPTMVELLQPEENSVNQGIDQIFKWSKAEDQTASKRKKEGEEIQLVGNYWFELSTDTTKASNIIDSTLTDTTKTVNGLEYLTDYWWRVKSRNEVGWSEFSEWSKFTTIIEKPEIVELQSPSNNAVGLLNPVELKWKSSERSEKYVLQISQSSDFTTTILDATNSDTAFTINNLLPLTSYYWRVKGVNISGESNWSEVWSFRTLGEPKIVELILPEKNSINQSIDQIFKWRKADDQTASKKKKIGEELQLVSKYWFELSTDTTKVSNLIDSTLTDTTKAITGLNYLTDYWWRVKSKNEVGWSGFTEWSKFTTLIEKPEVVELQNPSNNTVGLLKPVQLKWKTSDRVEIYNLQVSNEISFTTTQIDTILSDTSFTLISLEDLTNYYWRVKALNLGGESNWSEVWSFKTLGAPNTVSLVYPLDKAIDLPIDVELVWKSAKEQTINITPDVPISESVRKDKQKKSKVKLNKSNIGSVYSSENSSFSYCLEMVTGTLNSEYVINDSTITDTTKYISGLEYNTEYWWRVKAKNEVGWGKFSNWNSFTTLTNCLCGDVDCDSLVLAYDASLVLQHVVGLIDIDDLCECSSSADIDQDSVVLAYDASLILMNVVGLEVPAPNCFGGNLEMNLDYLEDLVFITNITKTLNNDIRLDFNSNDEIENVYSIQFTIESNKQLDSISISAPENYKSLVNIINGTQAKIALIGSKSISLNDLSFRLIGNDESFINNSIEIKDLYLNNYKISNNSVTTVHEEEIISKYDLIGAYPNPFNPSTKIVFEVPQTSDVKIKIYDILGREIWTSSMADVQMGRYEVVWDGVNNFGKNVSTGHYIAVMQTENYVKAIKLSLIK